MCNIWLKSLNLPFIEEELIWMVDENNGILSHTIFSSELNTLLIYFCKFATFDSIIRSFDSLSIKYLDHESISIFKHL